MGIELSLGEVTWKDRLRRFCVRDDAEYDKMVREYHARTLAGKSFYLFMHLLPGLLAYVLINVPVVAFGGAAAHWSC